MSVKNATFSADNPRMGAYHRHHTIAVRVCTSHQYNHTARHYIDFPSLTSKWRQKTVLANTDDLGMVLPGFEKGGEIEAISIAAHPLALS